MFPIFWSINLTMEIVFYNIIFLLFFFISLYFRLMLLCYWIFLTNIFDWHASNKSLHVSRLNMKKWKKDIFSSIDLLKIPILPKITISFNVPSSSPWTPRDISVFSHEVDLWSRKYRIPLLFSLLYLPFPPATSTLSTVGIPYYIN